MFLGPNSRVTGGVAARRAFPAGTQLAFINVVAPLGWVRVSTYDDALLRIVGSAAPSSGGSNGFSTVNAQTGTGTGSASGATDAHTLSTAEMPSHSHAEFAASNATTSAGVEVKGVADSTGYGQSSHNTASAGGGGSHTHTITGLSIPSLSVSFGIKYVDVLIARKA